MRFDLFLVVGYGNQMLNDPARQCGHGAFSDHKIVNDILGFVSRFQIVTLTLSR